MEVSLQVSRAKVYKAWKVFGTVKLRAEVCTGALTLSTEQAEGLEVQWGETFKIGVLMKNSVIVTVYAKAILTSEYDVGSAEIEVAQALENPESWWTLTKGSEQTGIVRLIVTAADLREDYCQRLNEAELQKEAVKYNKRKFLQKIEKIKNQKKACLRRIRELENPVDSHLKEEGTLTPNIPIHDLERRRENLSAGEEQLLHEKLSIQEERTKIAQDREQLLIAKEHILAELEKVKQENLFTGSPDTEEWQQLTQVRRTLVQKQEILEQQFIQVRNEHSKLQRARLELSQQKENLVLSLEHGAMKTPKTAEKSARTPLASRLLMTTSSNRLLTYA